ncbi:MAG TPA: hypothetical protein VGV38_03705, partial [Pyrinomonadaceae bacterium]|nr:hypothetical protein [Pyrinomonadaceae bacterium]
MKRLSSLTGRAARKAFCVFALSLLAATALGAEAAARPGGQRAGSKRSRAPRFEDYPVKEVYRGRPARVRLDSRQARMFRTRLREGARRGPNFAGRYAFVLWGCGTGCAQSGVVDLKTGRVSFPPVEYHDIFVVGDEFQSRRYLRLDSRLLILTRLH